MSRVAGKVAIITGAASGLGYAAAVKLMSEGAKVMLSDINDDIDTEGECKVMVLIWCIVQVAECLFVPFFVWMFNQTLYMIFPRS